MDSDFGACHWSLPNIFFFTEYLSVYYFWNIFVRIYIWTWSMSPNNSTLLKKNFAEIFCVVVAHFNPQCPSWSKSLICHLSLFAIVQLGPSFDIITQNISHYKENKLTGWQTRLIDHIRHAAAAVLFSFIGNDNNNCLLLQAVCSQQWTREVCSEEIRLSNCGNDRQVDEPFQKNNTEMVCQLKNTFKHQNMPGNPSEVKLLRT